MGAWSHDPFDNDTASDWVYALEESTGLEFLEETLDNALEVGEEDEDLEAPEAEEALAAIEVLVHMVGKGSGFEALPEAVGAWVATCTERPGPSLVQKALLALARIGSEASELRQLWEDSEDFQAWTAALDARTRILQSLQP